MITEAFEYPTTTDNPQIYEIYRWLRNDHPVYSSPDGSFYALSQFDDVWAAMGDWETFTSENVVEAQSLRPQFSYMDPPRHTHLRGIVAKAFTPSRIGDLKPRIRQLAKELVADLIASDDHDVVRTIAATLPSTVMGELIGIPKDQLVPFRELAEQFIGVTEHGKSRHVADQIYDIFEDLLEERRQHPTDDLISALIAAEVDGVHLTDDELLGFCLLLLLAGNDTTTSLIGSGISLLGQHPDQCASLVADPRLMSTAIEEMVRLESPTQVMPRTTRVDVELHGVLIPRGSRVQLTMGAANRDDRQFENPDAFDIRRPKSRHVGFGRGLHFCIGAPLARAEVQIVLEEFLSAIPDFSIGPKAKHVRSSWARSYEVLPIEF